MELGTWLVLAVCLAVFGVYMYSRSEYANLKCVVSSLDGNRYCVRDRQNVGKAADKLAEAVDRCKRLVVYMSTTYPDDERVKRLVEGFSPSRISETLPTDSLTAYSENKGQKIAFCLTRDKGGKRLIDMHTLTFVALHELSHIMTLSIGHKLEFWENFKFVLECAKEAGIHDPLNYKKDPHQYCGMSITDNPFYDLH